MTKDEAIRRLTDIERTIVPKTEQAERNMEVIEMAIYYIGIIDELKNERDAALDTAYAALKMRKEKKDG